MACIFNFYYLYGAKNTWFFHNWPRSTSSRQKWEHQISTTTKFRYNLFASVWFSSISISIHLFIANCIHLALLFLNFFLFDLTRSHFRCCTVNPNFFKKCDPCKPGIQCVPSIQCPVSKYLIALRNKTMGLFLAPFVMIWKTIVFFSNFRFFPLIKGTCSNANSRETTDMRFTTWRSRLLLHNRTEFHKLP